MPCEDVSETGVVVCGVLVAGKRLTTVPRTTSTPDMMAQWRECIAQ